MLLFRTTLLDSDARELVESLAEASGESVVIVADERNGFVDTAPYPKIVIDETSCKRLGLHTPQDFAWRCGDYCLYLALERYPDERAFWLIEFDVRVACAAEFFRRAAFHAEADLLAGYLAPARRDWPWWRFAAARDVTPWRCFFPVVRISPRAVQLLLEKRRSHSRQMSRRRAWPNDEVFVATTLAASPLTLLDLNGISDQPVYDTDTYSFRNILDETGLVLSDTRPQLYHPVLSDTARDVRARWRSRPPKKRTLPSVLSWKVCRAINRMRAW